jgi:hypothetical protein
LSVVAGSVASAAKVADGGAARLTVYDRIWPVAGDHERSIFVGDAALARRLTGADSASASSEPKPSIGPPQPVASHSASASHRLPMFASIRVAFQQPAFLATSRKCEQQNHAVIPAIWWGLEGRFGT